MKYALYLLTFILISSTAVSLVSAASLTTPSISPTNPTIDNGQSITLTATWTGGTSTYTINWYSGSSSTCSSDTTVVASYSGISGTSNTISISPTSSTYYCASVTDSSVNPATTSSATALTSVNNALSITSLTPGAPIIDSGQSINITASWAGGTGPYKVTWYTGPTTNTCQQDSANVMATYSSLTGTSNIISTTPTTENSYCIKVIDSAYSPITQFSSNYTITNVINSGMNQPISIAFVPSGAYAYVVNQGSSNVVIFNTSTNTLAGHITSGFTGGPRGVSISPDGSYAYVTNENTGTNGNVVIINTATNTVTSSITSGFDYPRGVAFSPDGSYAYVTNFNSNNVVIINTATNTVTKAITSGFSYPTGVAFSPDGSYAYVTNENTGTNGNVVIINTATNTVTSSITSGFSSPTGIAFSPSGTYAYVTNEPGTGNIVTINTVTNTVTGSLTVLPSVPSSVSFSPSNLHAYVTTISSGQYGVKIVNPGVGYEVYNSMMVVTTLLSPAISNVSIFPQNPQINSGQPVTFAVAITGGTSPYKTTLYSSSTSTCNDSSTLVQTISSMQTYGFDPTTGFAFFSTLTPKSNTYYCAYFTDNSAFPETLNTITSKVTINPALSTPIINPSNPSLDSGQSITLSSSWTGGTSTFIASLYSSLTSTCNQQSTLVQTQTGITTNSVTFSTVSPTSNTYYCSFISDNAINAYSIANTLTTGLSNPQSVAFSSDGTYAYVTNGNSNNVVIINTATNTVISAITSGFNSPEGVSFSPDGSYAYVTNFNSNNVVIINTATNTVTKAITSGFNSPYGVSFSPDGSYAYVTNSGSNNVAIINTATNTVTKAITSELNLPHGVAISPSGTFAYVANCNVACYSNNVPDNVLIISTATNTVSGLISSGFNYSAGIAFSPHGNYAYVTNCNSYCAEGPPGNIVIISTATNTVLNSINSGFDDIGGVAFSPFGTYAYAIDIYPANLTIINTGVSSTRSINTETKVYSALGTPTLSTNPSLPKTMETGSTITFTATASGGTEPYTYNYLITNTITGTVAASQLYTNVASTSNSFAWTIPSEYTGNTVYVNVMITDSAYSPSTSNSIKTSTLTITAGVSAGAITSTRQTISRGHNTTLTANVSGGTSPYTYNWYVLTGTVAPSCTTANQISGQNSNSITTSPNSTSTYAYQVTDSATTNSVACSPGDTVTVSTQTQVSNPYWGGPTGFYGNAPGTTASTSSTTTSTTTISIVTTNSSATTQICNDTSGYAANYNQLSTTFYIGPEPNLCFSITAINVTQKYRALNSSIIKAINYTSSSKNVSIDALIHYACNMPPSDITPLILRNNTWHEINPFAINVTACTISFAIPSDPVIALINTNLTTASTTANPTTVSTMPASATSSQQSSSWIIILIIIVIIVIAILVYLRTPR